MKKLPIGLQNFSNIIREGYLYVDKTEHIYNLINEGKLYFLSRPRRFGKSLLISTLKEILQGNKALFKGLYIAEKTAYNWTPYPVLQFNFAKLETSPDLFEDSLKQQLVVASQAFNIELGDSHLSNQVDELVRKIAQQGNPVVLLIDEYDKPIIDFLDQQEAAIANRKTLKKFFSPLKDLEAQGHLQFLFITGVSKFSKVSIFSDLNNLTDLTINRTSVKLTGITQQELLDNFKPFLERSAKVLAMPKEELLLGLKTWYNGYSWDGQTFLYNPFSLLNFFSDSRFGNFWFATGTPTFLVNILRDNRIDVKSLEGREVLETFFDKFSIINIDIYSLLFQTGYLTIKSIRQRKWQPAYRLSYPNEEVRQSFVQNLLEAFTYQPISVVSNVLLKMEDALEEGKVSVFVDQLEILLADLSFHLFPKSKQQVTPQTTAQSFAAWEGYFQTIIYLICAFLNLNVQAETTKHKGRFDLLAETAKYLYLMEFKLDDSAKNALAQIKSKQYALSYKNSPKRIFLVGIGFSKEERNVDSWEVEEWLRS